MSRFNFITDDVIDFAKFMDLTDNGHHVRSANDYTDDVMTAFFDPTVPKGAKTAWRGTHGKIAFRPGEVSIWSGFNGSGKSLLLGQVILGFLMQRERTCIASMEMRVVETLKRMIRQAEGREFPTKEFVQDFGPTVKDDLFFYDQMGMVDAEKLTGVINYAAKERGCQHFVVDSLMKCGMGEDDYNGQKRFLDRLCTIAKDTGIHVHLVAHSKKLSNENAPPGKMDVKGASSITDQADNVFCVWRNKPKEEFVRGTEDEADVFLYCYKQRHGEWEGRIRLWYQKESFQYLDNDRNEAINLFNPALYS